MASAISAITLLSDLYGLRIQPAVNDASREEALENPQDWPSLSSFLAVVTSCGLRQYNQELFLEGLRSPHIGEGLDYSVDLCEDVTKAELVIVKHVKLTLPTTKSHEKVESPIIRRFRKVHTEIRIMAHTPLHGSKYILNLLGFGWEFAEQAYMAPFLVVEYARHGTLRDFLRSTSPRDFAQKYALAEDVARGLQALHRCEIVHGDIKMENVLVCGMEPGDARAKIADFGSSIIGAAESDYVYYYGTEQYNAPELRGDIVEKNEASSATVSMAYMLDVYAYGLLVWEVVSDGAQFFLREDVHLAAERKDFQVIWKLALQDCSSYESGHSEKGIFSKVIEHTLLVDPEKRWNVDSILRNFRNPEKDRISDSENTIFSPLQAFKILPSGSDIPDSPKQIADIMATGDIGDHTGRMISLPPWDVQKAITFGVRGQIDHPEMTIAAKSALYLAICYILGFGVERDIDQMLHFMRKAAEMGVRGARHVVERLHEAFGRSCIVNFEALEDADEEEQASIIVESMKSAKYTTPWHSIDMVSQRRLSESIRKGIDPGIHHLAYLGMTDRLNELLESGVEDHQDGEGRTALYFACWGGHLSVIKALLSHGSDASIGDDDGYTPLHFLIMLPESDVAEAVSCIINSSEEVDINAFASEPLELPEGWMEISGTPLHWAIASHNITMVWALLKNGADVFSWDTGNSPIHLAASLHQYDILDILLQPENGFSIDLLRHQESPFFSLNASDPIWRTAIHGNNWKEAVSLTISALAQHWDINDLSDNQLGLTPLTKIAFANLSEVDVEIAACLLKFCIPDTRSKVFSALQSAIIGLRGVPLSSHAKIAHFMIGAGCSAHSQSSSPHNPSSRFKPGWNALHWAILQNNVSVCREILKRYQDLVHLATDDEFGDTPLNLATLGSLELIDLLLDHGADPAAESKKQGLTPLGSYLSDQRPETDTSILTRLIEISKDNDYIVFRREEECWTLLHYLSTRAAVLNMEGIQGQRLLQKVLADYPQVRALINIPTKNGWTALHLATYNVGYTAVRLLLEAGADPLLETPINGANAFNIAMERGRHAPHEQFRGSKSDIGGRWVSLAYKTLKILLRYMEDHDCFFDLSKLHLAAYIGHYEKVVRLVEKGVDPLARSEGETPAEMLRASLGGADVRFVERAEKVLGYLDGLDGRGNP